MLIRCKINDCFQIVLSPAESDLFILQDPHRLSSPLDPGNKLSQQCCERVFLATRDKTLKDIFSLDVNIKKSSLLLLHDLVQHSSVLLNSINYFVNSFKLIKIYCCCLSCISLQWSIDLVIQLILKLKKYGFWQAQKFFSL